MGKNKKIEPPKAVQSDFPRWIVVFLAPRVISQYSGIEVSFVELIVVGLISALLDITLTKMQKIHPTVPKYFMRAMQFLEDLIELAAIIFKILMAYISSEILWNLYQRHNNIVIFGTFITIYILSACVLKNINIS